MPPKGRFPSLSPLSDGGDSKPLSPLQENAKNEPGPTLPTRGPSVGQLLLPASHATQELQAMLPTASESMRDTH